MPKTPLSLTITVTEDHPMWSQIVSSMLPTREAPAAKPVVESATAEVITEAPAEKPVAKKATRKRVSKEQAEELREELRDLVRRGAALRGNEAMLAFFKENKITGINDVAPSKLAPLTTKLQTFVGSEG